MAKWWGTITQPTLDPRHTRSLGIWEIVLISLAHICPPSFRMNLKQQGACKQLYKYTFSFAVFI